MARLLPRLAPFALLLALLAPACIVIDVRADHEAGGFQSMGLIDGYATAGWPADDSLLKLGLLDGRSDGTLLMLQVWKLLRFELGLVPKAPAIVAVTLVLTVMPGWPLTDSMLRSYFPAYDASGIRTWWWYLPLTALALAELAERLDAAKLTAIVKRHEEILVAQRLGYLLDRLSRRKLTRGLADWVDKKDPPLRPLDPASPVGDGPESRKWRLLVNAKLEPEG